MHCMLLFNRIVCKLHICECKWIHTDAGLEVEVKDPPKGMIPPGTQMVKPKAEPQPSKVSSQVNIVKSAQSNFLFILHPEIMLGLDYKLASHPKLPDSNHLLFSRCLILCSRGLHICSLYTFATGLY